VIFGTPARVAAGSLRKKVIDESPDLLDGLANGNVFLIDPSIRCHVDKPLTQSWNYSRRHRVPRPVEVQGGREQGKA